MKMKYIVSAFCAVFMSLAMFAADAPAAAAAPAATEKWAVSLGGAGATTTDGDAVTGFGFDLSVGRYGKVLLPVEFGLRQGLTYTDSDVVLNTRVYNDWTLFTVAKKFDVFAGGNVGLSYGNTKPVWTIAPEAGFRWWLKDTVAVVGRVEVPFDMVEWEYNDTLRYYVGFLVRF
jgi:opacity protein-like surface antigen